MVHNAALCPQTLENTGFVSDRAVIQYLRIMRENTAFYTLKLAENYQSKLIIKSLKLFCYVRSTDNKTERTLSPAERFFILGGAL